MFVANAMLNIYAIIIKQHRKHWITQRKDIFKCGGYTQLNIHTNIATYPVRFKFYSCLPYNFQCLSVCMRVCASVDNKFLWKFARSHSKIYFSIQHKYNDKRNFLLPLLLSFVAFENYSKMYTKVAVRKMHVCVCVCELHSCHPRQASTVGLCGPILIAVLTLYFNGNNYIAISINPQLIFQMRTHMPVTYIFYKVHAAFWWVYLKVFDVISPYARSKPCSLCMCLSHDICHHWWKSLYPKKQQTHACMHIKLPNPKTINKRTHSHTVI